MQLLSFPYQSSSEVVQHRENGGLQVQWRPESLNATSNWDADNEDDIEPVDVLVPVLLGHGRLGDVWLLGVISGISDRLLWVWLRLGRRGGGLELRVHGVVGLAGLLGRHVDGGVGRGLGNKVSVTTKPARQILMPVAGSEVSWQTLSGEARVGGVGR